MTSYTTVKVNILMEKVSEVQNGLTSGERIGRKS